jgi:hypothetical protein
MTIADLRQQNLILFEAISGSRAYGTNLPHSDTDFLASTTSRKLPMKPMTRFSTSCAASWSCC